MTIYADSVTKTRSPTEPRDDLRGSQESRAGRKRRGRELTMAERLERAHHLCAQLAALRPVRSTRSK